MQKNQMDSIVPVNDDDDSYFKDENDRDAEQKAIDDWLPIPSARTANCWYSAFHNITAIVGAGVLALPYAMSELGWGPGIIILVLSWIVTLYSLWQMVEMHETDGKRFDRYHELGQHAFGEKLGLWIVIPMQLVVQVAVDIVYMVTAGKSIQKFHDLVCHEPCKNIKLSYFIMIFASVHFVLSQLPSLNSISLVSLAAAVMSISYSTIAWGASIHEDVQSDVHYGYRSHTTVGKVFNFFSSLGTVAFAYSGHNVVMEIQASMPSTKDKPSKVPMMRGVIIAYIAVAICYIPVGIIGYWRFGNTVGENILITLQEPKWLIAMANMFVVVHLIGTYQVYAMPVYDFIETGLVRKLGFRRSWYLRFVSRNSYVAFTMFMAITFPFFSALLGFFGGFVIGPTTYYLPCIIWLVVKKPTRFSRSWFANWFCIIFGACLTIVAPVGGLRKIIIEAKTYKFYE